MDPVEHPHSPHDSGSCHFQHAGVTGRKGNTEIFYRERKGHNFPFKHQLFLIEAKGFMALLSHAA